MSKGMKNRKKPNIVIGEYDHERLSQIAESAQNRAPDVAEDLMAELDRAKVVADKSVPGTTVQMGSTVEFETDDGQHRKLTLVYPAEADIEQNKISILTPIGTALIGLSPGQQMTWTDRDGDLRTLKIHAVEKKKIEKSA